MPIIRSQIKHFRNLKHLEIEEFSLNINVLYGDNGSGKTSFLESCYYLSIGRSFRTHHAEPLINHHAETCSVFAELENSSFTHLPHRAGFERSQNGSQQFRLDDQSFRSSLKIAHFFPIQLIDAHSHLLLEGSPSERRKFLNWGLFYWDPGFDACWRKYERALKQRNVLLKNRMPLPELSAWTRELIQYGVELDQCRKSYLLAWEPVFSAVAKQLLPQFEFSIRYHSGWSGFADFEAAIEASSRDEYRLGMTLNGPHRADLFVETQRGDARHDLSRGQQKLLVYAMILAQGELLEKTHTQRITYLIDDLNSELDMENQKKILRVLTQQRAQMLITAIEVNPIEQALSTLTNSIKLFHVKHGTVHVVHTTILDSGE